MGIRLTSALAGHRLLQVSTSPNIADADFFDGTPLIDEHGNVIPEKPISLEEIEAEDRALDARIIAATPSH